jgi:hypothetical protein
VACGPLYFLACPVWLLRESLRDMGQRMWLQTSVVRTYSIHICLVLVVLFISGC